MMRFPTVLALLFGAIQFFPMAASATQPTTVPPIGIRSKSPTYHALVGATVVAEPGRTVENATIVLRDGVIHSVVAAGEAPAGARIWDLTGRFIYPGFVDGYHEEEITAPKSYVSTPYWNSLVRPETDVADLYRPAADYNKKLRAAGITAQLVAAEHGIVRGQAAMISTGDHLQNRHVVQTRLAQCVELTLGHHRHGDGYPNSPMGAVALARQTMIDAGWYVDAWKVARAQSSLPRPERNSALAALQSLIEGDQPMLVTTTDERFFLRADRFAREFSLRLIVRGSGREYRRIAEIAATGRPIVLPVSFPKPPFVGTIEAAADVSLQSLMHWDIAPENPARLAAADVTFAFCTHGLKEPKEWLPAIRQAVRRGLSPDTALAAITTVPARLFELDDQMGSIDPGKRANFVVTDGRLFEKKTQVLSTWVEGVRYEVKETPSTDIRGTWEVRVELPSNSKTILLKIEGTPEKPTGKIIGGGAVASVERRPGDEGEDEQAEGAEEVDTENPDDTQPLSPEGVNLPVDATGDSTGDAENEEQQDPDLIKGLRLARDQISGQIPATALNTKGIVRFSAVVLVSDKEATWIGNISIADGTTYSLRAVRNSSPPADGEQERSGNLKSAPGQRSADGDSQPDGQPDIQEVDGESEDKPADDVTETGASDPDKEGGKDIPDFPALYPVNFPLGTFGRMELPTSEAIALRGATVWTCDDEGVLENGTVVIRDGKIVAVGTDIKVPADVQEIDCQGQHLTPGIIDCHSHIATDGGINESGQAITAEVRIGDFVNPNDITIYRHLAGGVTTVNVLHGSANPIGGQNQVMKLRWGSTGEGMTFVEAPWGIKFALGENVKQSNWGDNHQSRYPQTRMGVPELVRDAFTAAQEYTKARQQYARDPQGIPPRRDLELDAIAEILSGQRWIHCHSYRQDEIVALLNVLDQFGVTIGTLQHVLEGYKVTDVMRRHGAMGSSFADWWAYKIEVYDAIPYNGALMHGDGIVVSFNSDDAELGRHLNQEAAKAMKYGDVPEEEALKFVTIHPARQLRIDSLVGSLRAGKHADLVLWSGHPLSTMSRCEKTWVDGRRYFDREESAAQVTRSKEKHAALVQRILENDFPMQDPDAIEENTDDLWPHEDTFCGHHGHEN